MTTPKLLYLTFSNTVGLVSKEPQVNTTTRRRDGCTRCGTQDIQKMENKRLEYKYNKAKEDDCWSDVRRDWNMTPAVTRSTN